MLGMDCQANMRGRNDTMDRNTITRPGNNRAGSRESQNRALVWANAQANILTKLDSTINQGLEVERSACY